MATTTLVALLKREKDVTSSIVDTSQRFNEEAELSIHQTYKLLLDIIKMKPIRLLAAIMLTVKVTFAACDSVTALKLVDAGVPREKIALLVVPLVPLQIILPLVISKYTTGPRPMDVYIKSIPYRIVFANIAMLIVWFAPLTFSTTGEVPTYFYVILLINYAFYQVFLYSMFVAVMSFFAKISDPMVGGTYMTLLNTVCNLGGNWPTTVVLYFVDALTWRSCDGAVDLPEENQCAGKLEQDVSCLFNGNKKYY